ncbi:MAG: ATP-binding protein, partial [Oscillospiraceae bacterium]
RDNKTVINETIHNILVITIQALLWGILLAILLGFLFSRPVKNTLSRLTKRAETFANGEFDAGIEPVSKDEFGTLSKTFNDMGRVMNTSIKQMTAEKHKIEVILEHITNGVMAFDSDQNPIHINSTAMKLLEINETDVDTFDNFFAKLKAGVCMAEFLYLEKFKTEIRDIQIGKGHIRTYFVPFKMDNEKTAGVVCVFEDFTEQFNLEEVRQKFVAEVSHELKTPLTTIKTYTETLLNGYLDDKKTATSFLKTVEKETDKMTALVSNLLTLSRFDVKKFEMQKEPLDLDEVLQGLVKIFSLEAEIEDLDLIYNKVTEIPQIYADRDQIERAIKNVLSNAIKYCEPGGAVKIYAGNLYNEVYVKIEDNGKGIPKAEIEHVFERFYRVDKARTREKGGTGLGLSIAKEIIENHGGNIKIESEYGKYTRVIINLPMAKGIE